MFGNGYEQYIDRLNRQINELTAIRDQYKNVPQQPLHQPSNLVQNFQLSNSQNGIKRVNSIDDVTKEIVFSESIFLTNDGKNMFIKETNGNIRTFAIQEIVPKDEKDILIEQLQTKLNEMEVKMNEQSDVSNDSELLPKSISTNETTNTTNKSTSRTLKK